MDQYVHNLLTHKFCIAGAGDIQSSKRTYEVVMAGCIPVLLTHAPPYPDHALAFNNRVDWESFAIFVAPDSAPEHLRHKLETMSAEEIRRRQLAMNRYWRAFYIEMNHTRANDPLSGHQPDMLDYFLEEIYDRLPELEQRRHVRLDRG